MSAASDIRHAEKMRSFEKLGAAVANRLNPIAPAPATPQDTAEVFRRLDALQAEEVKDRKATHERKHKRLATAYGYGMYLRDNAARLEEFYAAENWKEFGGHKPRLNRDGPEKAIHFAVMRVFGGTNESRKEASLFALVSEYLAEIGTTPEGFLEALATMPGKGGNTGVRALADLARDKKREAKQVAQSQTEPSRPPVVGSIGALRVTAHENVPCSSKRELYLIVNDGQVVLSLSADRFEPVPVEALIATIENSDDEPASLLAKGGTP